MSRQTTIDRALAYFDDGHYVEDLSRRVAIPSESQVRESFPDCRRYLTEEMIPAFEEMGHTCRIFENPVVDGCPVLLAERMEDEALPTVLGYGHGDVVRGDADQWWDGLEPWRTIQDGDKLYGRGVADNKGQHTLNMRAMASALAERGRLGFNSKFMIESGEENGSAGLREVIEANLEAFAADVFIASDGPRVAIDRPTVILGARGALNFDLSVDLREGGHHSGNWGGLLANPGVILAHAIATMVSPTGRILIPEWLPPPLPADIFEGLADVTIDGGPNAPEIDPEWGEPDFNSGQQVFSWNSFEVLAFTTGNPENPLNAVPPKARANCHIRWMAGSKVDEFLTVLRRHLDDHGFQRVVIEPPPPGNAGGFTGSRTDPDHPWVKWTIEALERVDQRKMTVVPSHGGSICNDLFTDLIGIPAIWIPHSYGACSQHAPNEHILLSEARDAMALMAGLYWELGEAGTPGRG
jgi:acetylornithine deacetylase/succinyl-diaminopimelate desuccinylase-like protein